MAFLNEFKEKFNKAAQSVTSKTKDSVEITRLSGESRGIANELTSLYEQIGRIYVDSKGNDGESLAALCARAEELRNRLEDLERQRMQLKNQNRCPACGAVMGKSARFCSNCGRRMPEPAPEPEAAPEADLSYCPECGAMRKEDDKFCDVCGHSYAETEPEAEAPAAVRPAAEPEADGDEAPTDFDAE